MKRIDELKDVKTVAISGHMRPDGDCVCSCLALYHYLKKELPEAKIDVYLEEPPVPFHVLKGIDEIKSEFNSKEIYDVCSLRWTVMMSGLGMRFPCSGVQRGASTLTITSATGAAET